MLERRTAGAARAAASSGDSGMATQRRRKRTQLSSVPEASGTSDADDGTDDDEKEDGDAQYEDEEDDAQRSRKRRKQAAGRSQRSARPTAVSQPQELHQEGSSPTVASPDDESEMGIIEEIYCENFMCHRKMRVNLVSELDCIQISRRGEEAAHVRACYSAGCRCAIFTLVLYYLLLWLTTGGLRTLVSAYQLHHGREWKWQECDHCSDSGLVPAQLLCVNGC